MYVGRLEASASRTDDGEDEADDDAAVSLMSLDVDDVPWTKAWSSLRNTWAASADTSDGSDASEAEAEAEAEADVDASVLLTPRCRCNPAGTAGASLTPLSA